MVAERIVEQEVGMVAERIVEQEVGMVAERTVAQAAGDLFPRHKRPDLSPEHK
jgi:hypothetical protein